MIILGITGGVGAGKSTVLERLSNAWGAYTLQADKVGHLLMKRGTDCYERIIEIFGESILTAEGEIDRKKLGGIVFADSVQLAKLNAVIHPAVKEYILCDIQKKKEEGCRLYVLEAALLLEEHYDEICDDLWYIYVDAAIRRSRLKEARGYSDRKITEIFASQLPDEVFREKCRYVVKNNGELSDTYEQIDKRIREYGIM